MTIELRFFHTREVVHTDLNQLPDECSDLVFVAKSLMEKGFIIKRITSEYDTPEEGYNRLVGCEIMFVDPQTERLSKEIGKNLPSYIYYNAIFNDYIIDIRMITDKTEYYPGYINLRIEDISGLVIFRPIFERAGPYNIIGFEIEGVRDTFNIKKIMSVLFDY